MGIQKNIEEIVKQIDTYARKVGKNGRDIQLIAVTKTRSPEEILEALSRGITDIGENKVQEIQAKYDKIDVPVRWHLIGHLQTNKVKYIIDKVHMIHSVDSIRLAREIEKRASASGIVVNILIQVNAAGEESKFGVAPEQVRSLVDQILVECEHIRIKGLMLIAPFAEEPEAVRPYFKEVKKLYDQLAEIRHPGLDFSTLSMGMSNDFGVAIEEGANAVRVGTSIFGARDYSKQ